MSSCYYDDSLEANRVRVQAEIDLLTEHYRKRRIQWDATHEHLEALLLFAPLLADPRWKGAQ